MHPILSYMGYQKTCLIIVGFITFARKLQFTSFFFFFRSCFEKNYFFCFKLIYFDVLILF